MLRIRFVLPLIAAIIIGSFFGCTTADDPYRTAVSRTEVGNADAGPDCSETIELLDGSYTTAVESIDRSGVSHQGRTSCYLSDFLVPNGAEWRDEPGGKQILQPAQYKLAFVELPERKRVLPQPAQLDELLSHLSAPGQHVVMVYVHGWRHDADIGNGNVLRFRTMLGYARSALNSRCLDAGKYCQAKLTGVYVGWRGRSVREPTSANAADKNIKWAALSVLGRKSQSDRLARSEDYRLSFNEKSISPIGYVLRHIEGTMKKSPASNNKMLTVGHSFGGNMLATYLEGESLARIKDHQNGQTMAPVLGDLVVLLNPASEAAKWTSIQAALREKGGVSGHNWVGYTGMATAAEKKSMLGWHHMFPKSQRPIYVSLTATANWSPGEFGKDRKTLETAYDKATAYWFPLSRRIAFDKSSREQAQLTAIGHFMPTYKALEGIGPNVISGSPLGVSHEFIVNSGAKFWTTYANSGRPEAAKCGTHDGWLRVARQEKLGTGEPNWDSSYDAHGAKRALLNRMPNGAEVQIRHSLYIAKTADAKAGRAESVAQGRSPFWNMRGFDTAISGHSNFMNLPTLCGINILWLDDATGPGVFHPNR